MTINRFFVVTPLSQSSDHQLFKPWKYWVAGVLSLLLFLLSVMNIPRQSGELGTVQDPLPLQKLEDLYQKAKASYFAGSYLEAYGYLRDHTNELFSFPEGCELMISVFAELKRLSDLEKTARQCLGMKKAIGISAEALAMALSSVGQSREALTLLEGLENYQNYPRVLVSMSQLCLYLEDSRRARDLLFLALNNTREPWSPWLNRVFRHSAYQQPEFLKKIAQLILQKREHIHDLELRLMELLKDKGLLKEAELLSVRMKKYKN